MAGKSRSLNFILLVCALIGAALFYGCGGGGGGNSSDPLPVTYTQITGKIETSELPLNIVYEGNLKPELRGLGLGGVSVWLESDFYNKKATTLNDGTYFIDKVTPGKHRIVAKYTNSSGQIYKTISEEVSVVEGETKPVNLTLKNIHLASISLTGLLKDASNSQVPVGGKVLAWGEPFEVTTTGQFVIPMPTNAIATMTFQVPGYQTSVLPNVTFKSNPPVLEQFVVTQNSTNRPPTVFLYGSSSEVAKLGAIKFTANVYDPDNNIATYSWSSSDGYFADHGATDLSRNWMAPNADKIATVTLTIVDMGGLKSIAKVSVKVGLGEVKPNSPPQVSDIVITPQDIRGDRTYTLSVTATDQDSDRIYYKWSSNPASGVFLLDSNNQVSWKSPDVVADTPLVLSVTVDDRRPNGRVEKTRSIVVGPTQANQPPTGLAIQLTNIDGTQATEVKTYQEYYLTGVATDPESETLTWNWSGAGTFIDSTKIVKVRWRAPSTPQTATINLTVTDPKNASNAITRSFDVVDSGLIRPTVSITASPNQKLLKRGDKITFTGSGIGSNGVVSDVKTFVWYGRPDGGEWAKVSEGLKEITRQYDSPGTYSVYLEAEDSIGVPGESASYNFRINATPTATIAQPANNSSYNQYAAVTFTGTASDIEDGSITNDSSFVWTFPAPTGVRTGRTFSLNDLATGTHNISLCVADSLGDFSAASTVRVTINANQAPVATITEPDNNTTVLINTPLTFKANASDPEGEIIPAGNYLWVFPDPVNATTGTSITVNNLPMGPATVTLRVADSRNLFSATRTVEVYINRPPVISMISVDSIPNGSGAAVLLGAPAKFGVSVTDEEEPSLSQIAWYKGTTLLGRGPNIEVSTLTVGLHAIKVEATDKRGYKTASETGVFINERPIMTITQPAATSFKLNELISFAGTATDTTGVVGLASYRWYDYGNKLGKEVQITEGDQKNLFSYTFTNSNQFGTHTIRLEGVDQYGAAGNAYKEIFINDAPSVTMTGPASGTRIDTDTDAVFTANVIEKDSEDILTVKWFADVYPSASPLDSTTGSVSSESGNKTFSFTTSSLTAGPHTIFCEVTDMYGLQAVASTGVLINQLPYAQSGKIMITTAQYATTTANIPVFLSTDPNMEIGFKIDDFDYEINGSINSFKPENIKWEWKSDLQPNWTAFVTSNGSTATQTFKFGYNEVTVRLYDSFYPEFEQQASATYQIAFYVWNSTSITNICNNPVDMYVESTKVYLASKAAPGGVFYYNLKNAGDAYPNILADPKKNISLASGPFDPVYACSLTEGGAIVALGLKTAVTTLASFEETGTPSFRVFAGLDGATSLAFSSDETLAYVTSGNTIVTFNPSLPTWAAVGTPKTDADGINFGTLGRIRYPSLGFADQVFVADPTNKRVVRYFTNTLSGAQSIESDLSPIDMTTTSKRVIMLNSNSQLSLHAVDNASSSAMITFGGITTTGEAGKFNNPIAVYYTNDCILVLEAGDVDTKRRIQIIRSGLTDLLK